MLDMKEFKVGDEVFYVNVSKDNSPLPYCWHYNICKGNIKAFIDWETVVVGDNWCYSLVVSGRCIAKTKTKLLAQMKAHIRNRIKELERQIKSYKNNFADCVKNKYKGM